MMLLARLCRLILVVFVASSTPRLFVRVIPILFERRFDLHFKTHTRWSFQRLCWRVVDISKEYEDGHLPISNVLSATGNNVLPHLYPDRIAVATENATNPLKRRQEALSAGLSTRSLERNSGVFWLVHCIAPGPQGVPQIEITFDLDVNGILNVSAIDKSSGKQMERRITHDKGRLSKDDVDRMVDEAVRHRDEDEMIRAKIAAKEGLQLYCSTMEAKFGSYCDKDKVPESVKKAILERVKKTLSWLEANQQVKKEEYEAKQVELRDFHRKQMSKM